jgi:RNA polymerase sigma factor (sigma-70 family)
MSSGEGLERRDFATTRWSLVAAAGRRDSPEAAEALETLCEHYWYPLYAYVRRRGLSPEDARDLTQEFFATLLEKDRLRRADPNRGRFRAFLLASLANFLANRQRYERADRRGGGRVTESLDWESGEQRYLREPIDELTPERVFDRRWALTILERSIDRLRAQHVESGRGHWFEALRETLMGGTGGKSYDQLAQELGVSESAVKVAIHRMRKRCGELLREEIAQTVTNPQEIDEELAYLFAALG